MSPPQKEVTMTPVSCESWNLTSPIASRVYLTTHLLQSAFIAALKPIMSGRMRTIAAGLILAGAILSSIWVLHSHLVLLPHPWGIAALLTACGILACSAWVGNMRSTVQHLLTSRRSTVSHSIQTPIPRIRKSRFLSDSLIAAPAFWEARVRCDNSVSDGDSHHGTRHWED